MSFPPLIGSEFIIPSFTPVHVAMRLHWQNSWLPALLTLRGSMAASGPEGAAKCPWVIDAPQHNGKYWWCFVCRARTGGRTCILMPSLGAHARQASATTVTMHNYSARVAAKHNRVPTCRHVIWYWAQKRQFWVLIGEIRSAIFGTDRAWLFATLWAVGNANNFLNAWHTFTYAWDMRHAYL